MAELTPMMRQYMEEKEKHPDSLLFFRLGDFYEMFGPDARTASRELDLALTTRDKDKSKSDEERIPMCGVPYHSAEGYIARLIAKGYKVSICEQMEDPALAKGLVKREIIRTVTPGTVLDEACLDAGRSNYLCGVYLSETAAGLCAADISTGQAQVTAFTGAQRLTGLINELGRFAPAEAVMNAAAYDDPALTAALEERFSCRRERLAEGRFDVSDAEKKVRLQFGEAALRDLPRNESAPLLALGGLPPLSMIDGALLKYFGIPVGVTWFMSQKTWDGKKPFSFVKSYTAYLLRPKQTFAGKAVKFRKEKTGQPIMMVNWYILIKERRKAV